MPNSVSLPGALPQRLRSSDLSALLELELEANEDAWSETLLGGALADPEQEVWGWWAEDGRHLLAMAVVAFSPFDAEIQSLSVHPSVRRQGVARRLLEWIIQAARRQDMERLLLEVRASNAAAQALYAGMEFAIDGRRCGYYRRCDGSGEDAVLMSRALVEH